jgi:pimeloyl-ACP methyl ester carboxylesterase
VTRLERPPDELRALGRLAFAELADAVGGIGGVHRAISGRVFGHIGPGAAAARAGHDAIATGVYAGLCGAMRLAGAGVARVTPPREVSTTPRGGLVVGVLNGLRGDVLEAEGSPLHQPMAVRVRGRPVDPTPDALAAAFPVARPRLVVFLHGLMETERAWRIGGGATYGVRLERDLGVTAVDVRYNSGRHISENGRSLAELLEAVCAAWPVEASEVALVGHSMGGLVARSACHVASEDGMAWVKRVRHVVSLGSPHMGAPLAQAVHYAGCALHAVPETRPFGNFLRRGSAGIRDLRQGSLVDEDWMGLDPHALRAAACREVPLLEGATHCFVAATVTRDARHPVGRLLGDALVLQPSASGRSRTRRIPFRAEDGMHLGGAHHLALLNHPAVYERLNGWLATPLDGLRGRRRESSERAARPQHMMAEN